MIQVYPVDIFNLFSKWWR